MNNALPSLLAFLATILARGAVPDAPQWRGPNRDGNFPGSGLLDKWPAEGPPLAWKITSLGKGMSSVAVADGRLFTMGNRNDGQHIVAIDLKSQRELWATRVSSKGDEPRCTPTISGHLVFALSTDGEFLCCDAGSGREVWRKSFAADFGSPPVPTWGFSESPLVDGEKLVVIPGASEAFMVALDKKTGAVHWKTAAALRGKGHNGAGYSGAVISTAGGIRQYVTIVGKGAIGVAANDGKLLWHYNRVANDTAVIPTPLVWGDYVFVSSGYGTGAALLKIAKTDVNVAAPSKAGEAKIAELTRKLASLNAELAKRRELRGKTSRGTPEWEQADAAVQAAKPEIAKTEDALNAAQGNAPSGAIAGSPLIAEEQYFLDAGTFQNHHGGMVRIGDYIYAGKGHNNGFPICLEWKTGRVVWQKERGPGKESAAVIAADDHLYFRYQDGIMALIEATPGGYAQKGAFKLAHTDGPSWPHPVIHDGRLYLRSQDVLMCYDLRKK